MIRRDISNRMILGIMILVVISATCCIGRKNKADTSLSKDTQLRVYIDPTPPDIDPYIIQKGTIFGADQGEDTYLLSRPIPRGIAPDGSLFISDVQGIKVHRFAPDGTHLGKFGKGGAGPGEFQRLQDLIVDGDRLYVNDPSARRVTTFNLDGDLLEVITFPKETVSSPNFTLYGPPDNRRFYIYRPLLKSEIGEGWIRVIRLNEALEVIDTPIDSTWATKGVYIGNTRWLLPVYDHYVPVAALAPGMPFAWSFGKEFRIEFMDPVDCSRWAVMIPHDAAPISREAKQRTFDRFERMNQAEEARRKLEFGSHFPHIGLLGFCWDNAGRLWVPEFTDLTNPDAIDRFYVFSRNGEWLFRQDLPKIPRLITGDGIYCNAEDEEGNPIIQFYRFVEK